MLQATAGTINGAAQHERQSPFRVGLSERFKGEITPDKGRSCDKKLFDTSGLIEAISAARNFIGSDIHSFQWYFKVISLYKSIVFFFVFLNVATFFTGRSLIYSLLRYNFSFVLTY